MFFFHRFLADENATDVSLEVDATDVPTEVVVVEGGEDGEEGGGGDLSAHLSNIFLFFLIFGLSATVNVGQLKRQLRNKAAIGCGVFMQFLVLPLLGYLSVEIFHAVGTKGGGEGLSEAMGITLLVVTASPGGSFSNLWCSLFNADLALSVAMTTVSSVLSIGMLPANLFIYTYLAYGNVEETEKEGILEALDMGALFGTLVIVLFAIMGGIYAGATFDNVAFREACNRFASISGLMLILFSVFLSSGGGGSEESFWNQDYYFYCAVAFPCLAGIFLANFFARFIELSPPETVTIAIECCYQNTGIATAVAIAMFDDPNERARAIAVPLLYGVVEATAISAYCLLAWKLGMTKAPADESFWVIISNTYEIETKSTGADDDDDGNSVGDDQPPPTEETGLIV